MIVKCASCGWTDGESSNSESFRGAEHLRSCPKRDDLRYVPWWTILDDVFEVGWHPLSVNEPTWKQDANGHAYREAQHSIRYRFTEYADRELIGVKP